MRAMLSVSKSLMVGLECNANLAIQHEMSCSVSSLGGGRVPQISMAVFRSGRLRRPYAGCLGMSDRLSSGNSGVTPINSLAKLWRKWPENCQPTLSPLVNGSMTVWMLT